MTLDLNARVREILGSSSEADPGEIAKAVLATLRPDQFREALEQALRLFVRQGIKAARHGTSTPAAPRSINPSAKVAAIRNDWQARLHDRYHVGNQQWKFLADMTYADLMTVAAERRSLAERNAAWAEQMEAWAGLVAQAGVQTFGQLSDDDQMSALRAAA